MKLIWKLLIFCSIGGLLGFSTFSVGFFAGLMVGFPENVTFGYDTETLFYMNYSYYEQTEQYKAQLDQNYLQENYNLHGNYWKDGLYRVYINPINKQGFSFGEITLNCINNTIFEVKQ
jgi:hypothetical protein